MKLYPEKLAAALAKGIQPAYLLHGDEPLGIMEAGDQIRSAALSIGRMSDRPLTAFLFSPHSALLICVCQVANRVAPVPR